MSRPLHKSYVQVFGGIVKAGNIQQLIGILAAEARLLAMTKFPEKDKALSHFSESIDYFIRMPSVGNAEMLDLADAMSISVSPETIDNEIDDTATAEVLNSCFAIIHTSTIVREKDERTIEIAKAFSASMAFISRKIHDLHDKMAEEEVSGAEIPQRPQLAADIGDAKCTPSEDADEPAGMVIAGEGGTN